jgi:cell division protease FtsH
MWNFDSMTVAMLDPEKVSREFVVTKFTNDFAVFLQGEGVEFDNQNVEITSSIISRIPWGDIVTGLSVIALIVFAIFVLRGLQSSGNKLSQFGQSKARMFFGKKPEITFANVAGVDEAKSELEEIVMFLKQPAKFLKMGARIPKGVLMVGSPGTGKTLLAKAIAGEAGVPFFHTSGAEFEEMLVGAGASRIRDLFAKAKKAAPALIFIDEIDALARKRGTTVQSSTTEQTLNQILVEMDGFEKNAGVIIIAATNRPDVLDPAILRPGRFDRRLVLDLPDIEGRKQILKIHGKGKTFEKGLDMGKVAKRTVGFSGADLENMLNEAAILAVRENKKEISFNHIEESATKVTIGPERKRKRTEEELKLTAYHEAGHAIVAKFTPKSDPVHRITIISRGMSLGSTMQLPQEDKLQMTKTEMESRIRVMMGGRAAEEIVFGDVTSGASNDIEQATRLARKMVKQFGMSDKLGMVKYGESNELQYLGYGYGEQRDYAEKTAREIDTEVEKIIKDAYEDAKSILLQYRKKLDKVSKVLLKEEVVEDDEFEKLMKD